MKEILDIIHKTIYQFFDVCGEDEECNISDKDKLLLEVNKAICTNLKALEPKEPFINKPCASEQECHENKMKVLEEIKSELWMEGMNMTEEYQGVWVRFRDIERIINKYMNESEEV